MTILTFISQSVLLSNKFMVVELYIFNAYGLKEKTKFYLLVPFLCITLFVRNT